jgi:hypothetical protein
MIAGCADTGLLALCAHVAELQTLFDKDSVHFHLIDRCRTPLILCEEFAETYNLRVTTQLCRIPEDSPGFTADLIVSDSLFRFFPHERQPDVMRYLAGAQVDGGVFVYGHVISRTPPLPPRPGNSDSVEDLRGIITAEGYSFDQDIVSDRHMRFESRATWQTRRYIAVAVKDK